MEKEIIYPKLCTHKTGNRCLLFSVLGQRLSSTHLCSRHRARALTPGLSKGHLTRREVFDKPERSLQGFAVCEGMAVLSGALCCVSAFQGREPPS